MCGIFGTIVLGNKAEEIVLAGLKRLEYRGYDSWGVVSLVDQELKVAKDTGKISEHKQLKSTHSQTALGHTRWATHGGVTPANAHPHLAQNHAFALVQNGVIENYQSLKKKLISQKYRFLTETDTEVMVGLIEKFMDKMDETELTRTIFRTAFKQLRGRNTVAALTRSGKLMAIRYGSPLILAKNKNHQIFISSDLMSLSGLADEYFIFDQHQGVEVSNKDIVFFDSRNGKKLHPKFKKMKLEEMNLDKSGFDHFMKKEIFEQSELIDGFLDHPSQPWSELTKNLQKASHIYCIGAGSAYYSALSLSYQLRAVGLPATAVASYEADSHKQLIGDDDLAILISQSGETADTNEVAEWLKNEGTKLVSLVNMPGSTLTRLSDLPFMLGVGPEIGVASTKALTSQFLWGWVVAKLAAGSTQGQLKKTIDQYKEQLSSWLPKLDQKLEKLAKNLSQHSQLFILGKDQLLASTLEFALKIKEISYLHAEGFAAGELKHGVIALVEDGTPVFCLIANDAHQNEMLGAAAEVKARGARVIGVSLINNELFDEWIKLPKPTELAFISSIIPAQLLTYRLAVIKGFDPDKPRNLAKSVTVK